MTLMSARSVFGDTAREDGSRRLLPHNQRMSRTLSVFPVRVSLMPKSTSLPMRIGSAPTVFRTRISEQQWKRSREWMITFGEAEMNKRSNHSLMKRGVSPGLPRQLCPGKFQILKRSAHGYAGAISILIQQVIGSRLRFQLWSYSGTWMTLFLP